jgi:hypothetical protein
VLLRVGERSTAGGDGDRAPMERHTRSARPAVRSSLRQTRAPLLKREIYALSQIVATAYARQPSDVAGARRPAIQ